ACAECATGVPPKRRPSPSAANGKNAKFLMFTGNTQFEPSRSWSLSRPSSTGKPPTSLSGFCPRIGGESGGLLPGRATAQGRVTERHRFAAPDRAHERPCRRERRELVEPDRQRFAAEPGGEQFPRERRRRRAACPVCGRAPGLGHR